MMVHMELQKKRVKSCSPPGTLFLITLCIHCSLFYLYFGSLHRFGSRVPGIGLADTKPSNSFQLHTPESEKFPKEELDCDLFDGKWVWDESYPLYASKDCLFVEGGFRCSENGRPDDSYTKWRWQPNHCDLPRFDAKMMLEKLRNKRVVFAGDSVGRTQWESLLCMLASAVDDKSSIYELNGSPISKRQAFLAFMFRDYNCTLEYYKASFLVLDGSAPPGAPQKVRKVLKLDQLVPVSREWSDADLLILNSGHWWTSRKTLRRGVFFQEGNEMRMNMSVESAFGRAMETLVNWVGREVNLSKTLVFFRTYAPHHFSDSGTCDLETLPDLMLPFSPDSWPHYKISSDVLPTSSRLFPKASMKMNLLNVTYLTGQRNGHCSLYNHNLVPYYKRRKRLPRYRQDCLHWCLPGVPDTWNELLHAIFLKREGNMGFSRLYK